MWRRSVPRPLPSPSRHRGDERRGGDLDFSAVAPPISRVGLTERPGREPARATPGNNSVKTPNKPYKNTVRGT